MFSASHVKELEEHINNVEEELAELKESQQNYMAQLETQESKIKSLNYQVESKENNI